MTSTGESVSHLPIEEAIGAAITAFPTFPHEAAVNTNKVYGEELFKIQNAIIGNRSSRLPKLDLRFSHPIYPAVAEVVLDVLLSRPNEEDVVCHRTETGGSAYELPNDLLLVVEQTGIDYRPVEYTLAKRNLVRLLPEED